MTSSLSDLERMYQQWDPSKVTCRDLEQVEVVVHQLLMQVLLQVDMCGKIAKDLATLEQQLQEQL